ncbi:hypothetical protein [Streptomyces sp. NPDC058613]|uniref:hypothetical protein n=1 Tax=unclassified Streptomyces TaxID=2593676 RepID=UPI003647FBB2
MHEVDAYAGDFGVGRPSVGRSVGGELDEFGFAETALAPVGTRRLCSSSVGQ